MTPILAARRDGGGRLFAAVDPAVRYVKGEVRDSRMGAMLAPFPTHIEARAALVAAGGQMEEAA
jgi:hypothetical protein